MKLKKINIIVLVIFMYVIMIFFDVPREVTYAADLNNVNIDFHTTAANSTVSGNQTIIPHAINATFEMDMDLTEATNLQLYNMAFSLKYDSTKVKLVTDLTGTEDLQGNINDAIKNGMAGYGTLLEDGYNFVTFDSSQKVNLGQLDVIIGTPELSRAVTYNGKLPVMKFFFKMLAPGNPNIGLIENSLIGSSGYYIAVNDGNTDNGTMNNNLMTFGQTGNTRLISSFNVSLVDQSLVSATNISFSTTAANATISGDQTSIPYSTNTTFEMDMDLTETTNLQLYSMAFSLKYDSTKVKLVTDLTGTEDLQGNINDVIKNSMASYGTLINDGYSFVTFNFSQKANLGQLDIIIGTPELSRAVTYNGKMPVMKFFFKMLAPGNPDIGLIENPLIGGSGYYIAVNDGNTNNGNMNNNLMTFGQISNSNEITYEYNIITIDKMYLVGDVDGDGQVMQSDFELVKQFVLGEITSFPLSTGRTCADVDGDGKVTSKDYALIKKLLKGN